MVESEETPQPELLDNGDGTWSVICGNWSHIFTIDEMKDIMTPIPPLPDEKIREIANGMFHGKILSSMQVEPSAFPMVFAAMMFADELFRTKLMVHRITFFYEYIDKALPRAVNGYPMFMSMNIIGNDDAEKVLKIYYELRDREGLES